MVEPKVLDLNRVVTDTEKMLRRLIGEDVELQAVMDPELRRVKADWGQMQQIFLNLAVNARDAMPKGGRLTLETANVDLSRDFTQEHPGSHLGPHVRLSVTDTGTGMDAETQAHIFEPFFTTKEKGVGTGLGLATVYGIVKQGGGYISVRSQEGKGTTFSIYFPQVEDRLAEKEEAVVEAPEPGNETILVVEDEVSVRRLARDFLERRGYKVLEAPGPLEAIEMVHQYEQPIHLLLTDIVMPKMNGSELAGKVLSWRPKTKVLYMSGYTDDPLLWRGFQRHDNAFLQKPFTLDALAREIRNVLDN